MRERIWHSLRMRFITSAIGRAKYIRDHDLFRHMGNNCMVMFRKIPLYPKLISIGDNVWIASGVSLIPHDVIHQMLNNYVKDYTFQENVGCIDIKDNVFIGSNSTILPNVTIGPNTIVGAGTLVNASIPGGVYAGVPARYICSLEEFIEKRKNETSIETKKVKGNLTDEIVEKCWVRFYEKQEEREKH